MRAALIALSASLSVRVSDALYHREYGNGQLNSEHEPQNAMSTHLKKNTLINTTKIPRKSTAIKKKNNSDLKAQAGMS